jgi:hypothetical protein
MYFRNRFAVDTNTRDYVPPIDDSVGIQDLTLAVSIPRKKSPVKSLNNSGGGVVIPKLFALLPHGCCGRWIIKGMVVSLRQRR